MILFISQLFGALNPNQTDPQISMSLVFFAILEKLVLGYAER
jgi:hypothetical protein